MVLGSLAISRRCALPIHKMSCSAANARASGHTPQHGLSAHHNHVYPAIKRGLAPAAYIMPIPSTLFHRPRLLVPSLHIRRGHTDLRVVDPGVVLPYPRSSLHLRSLTQEGAQSRHRRTVRVRSPPSIHGCVDDRARDILDALRRWRICHGLRRDIDPRRLATICLGGDNIVCSICGVQAGTCGRWAVEGGV